MVGWTVQLFEFNISFERRGHVKAQALANFMTVTRDRPSLKLKRKWRRCYPRRPQRSTDQTNNNQFEYEALLARMKLAGELGVQILTAKSDSKLDKATKLATSFEKFTLLHVPRKQNERINLSKLASTQRSGSNRSIIHKKIYRSMVEESSICCVKMEQMWMNLLLEYFKKDIIPKDLKVTKRLRQEESKYTLLGEHLYKRGYSFPLLGCLDTKEAKYVMRKVHEEMCGSHIKG
ncbi:hypothetical protein CR513_23275, partial [Mucuna pruriens]